MKKYTLVGCDLHDASMLLKVANGRGTPVMRSFGNTGAGRTAMVAFLKATAAKAGSDEIVFGYEASGQGFGLYDELTETGIICHVLAPTKISRSSKHKRAKTDERDAERVLELLRGHLLAGNPLPDVWIPNPQTRDDREIVRARLGLADRLRCIKTQIKCLLKRNAVTRPGGLGKCWTNDYWAWLSALAKAEGDPKVALPFGAGIGLQTLLNQVDSLEQEIRDLDGRVEELSRTDRYAGPAQAMTAIKGVGLLTAMVYLTEMGDLTRFSNRRQIGAFLGLVPSSDESGEKNDRKGHITHQGPYRVRAVLCQAALAAIRSNPIFRSAYDRMAKSHPKRKKIFVVAAMRRLAIVLWHKGLDAWPPGERGRKVTRGPDAAAAA